MDEILKIIFERNKERQLLTIDDIKKICDVVITKNKYDFVKEVIVAKEKPNDESCGGIFSDDRIIFFYTGIINLITKYCENFTDLYQIDGSTVDILNFYYLTIIFHELSHARQHSLILKNHNNLEKNLFSFFFELSKDQEFYQHNYDDILTEVNAINTSYMTAQYFYSKLPYNFMSKADNNTYRTVTLKMMLYSNYAVDPKHEVIFSPAERIAQNFDDDLLAKANMNISKYANLIYNEKLTLYKKLMLGLPISYLEYAYANLLINELSGEEDINAMKKLQKKI